jgi:hypothetical protein
MNEREDIVRVLAAAANDGLQQAVLGLPDCSASEVFSAYLTLMATMIHVMQEMKVPNRTIRNSIEQLLLRCPTDSGTVN